MLQQTWYAYPLITQHHLPPIGVCLAQVLVAHVYLFPPFPFTLPRRFHIFALPLLLAKCLAYDRLLELVCGEQQKWIIRVELGEFVKVNTLVSIHVNVKHQRLYFRGITVLVQTLEQEVQLLLLDETILVVCKDVKQSEVRDEARRANWDITLSQCAAYRQRERSRISKCQPH